MGHVRWVNEVVWWKDGSDRAPVIKTPLTVAAFKGMDMGDKSLGESLMK